MEILYARVQHIIAMNQGIQMLNARTNWGIFLQTSEYSKVSRTLITIFWRRKEYFVKTPTYSTAIKTSTALLSRNYRTPI